jgi:hypothetical protein
MRRIVDDLVDHVNIFAFLILLWRAEQKSKELYQILKKKKKLIVSEVIPCGKKSDVSQRRCKII